MFRSLPRMKMFEKTPRDRYGHGAFFSAFVSATYDRLFCTLYRKIKIFRYGKVLSTILWYNIYRGVW